MVGDTTSRAIKACASASTSFHCDQARWAVWFYVRRLLKQLLSCDRQNHYVLFTAWWNDESIDLSYGRFQKIMAVHKEEAGETIPSGGDVGGATPTSGRASAFPSLGGEPLSRSPRLGASLGARPVVLSDDEFGPRHLAIPTVVTVADIQQEYYPEFFTREELQARALMYGPSCQEATRSSRSRSSPSGAWLRSIVSRQRRCIAFMKRCGAD